MRVPLPRWAGLLVVAALVAIGVFAHAAEELLPDVPEPLVQGIKEFGAGEFSDALLSFREILLDPRLEPLQADAYFWIGKAYLALEQYDDAIRNFDTYLGRFPRHLFVEEARYQRGRLLYLQGNPESSIVSLAEFVHEFPDSDFAASAYFWIGEALFLVGELDTSREMFTAIVERFPRSAKVEAARYRTSVIDLRQRESELLRLLKWSHEESLRLSEDSQRREADLEQAIASLRRRIVELEGGAEAAATLAARDARIQELKQELTATQRELVASAQQTAAAEQTATTSDERAEIEMTRQLLNLKEDALQIQQEIRDFLATQDES